MPKIYLDMDRVIADFDNGVRKYALIEPPDQNDEKQVTEMWKLLSNVPHFYDKLELMPGAKCAVTVLFELFGKSLEILTGIPNPTRGLPTAGADKESWTAKNINKEIVVNTVRRADKKNFCTGKDCILIDDNEQNIREWEAAGGTGILFRDWSQAMNEICRMFSRDISATRHRSAVSFFVPEAAPAAFLCKNGFISCPRKNPFSAFMLHISTERKHAGLSVRPLPHTRR